MARAKAPARKPAEAPAPKATDEINGAGDGAGGGNPASATEAGGDAIHVPTTPATGEGATPAPDPVPPAAIDAAGTDAQSESLAEPQGEAGGVAVPHAAGGGGDTPTADAPAPVVTVRIRALFAIEADGVRIEIGEEAAIRAELVPQLLACRAAELLPDEAA